MAQGTEDKVKTNKLSPAGRGWLYGVLAVLIIILVFAAGAGFANHNRFYRTAGFFDGSYGMRYSGLHHGMMDGWGGTYISNGETRTRGVVTSVNGNDFTVAGNGSTTKVSTSSSTQYQGGNQVKQNDTVIVFGTTSNDTLNATRIIINP